MLLYRIFPLEDPTSVARDMAQFLTTRPNMVRVVICSAAYWSSRFPCALNSSGGNLARMIEPRGAREFEDSTACAGGVNVAAVTGAEHRATRDVGKDIRDSPFRSANAGRESYSSLPESSQRRITPQPEHPCKVKRLQQEVLSIGRDCLAGVFSL